MEWICGIQKKSDRFVARVGSNYSEVTRSLRDLGKVPITLNKRHKSKLDTNFDDWRIASSVDYIATAGLNVAITDEHRVFTFHHEGTTYLVPTIVFFKAMFRPLSILAEYLFRPSGLNQVCVPKDFNGQIEFVIPGINHRIRSCLTLQQPLSWMWCYPSAKRMWDSVYEYANQGMLACELPKGSSRVVVTGARLKGRFLVNEMTILQVHTTEAPFAFAPAHSSTIVFHDGVHFRSRKPSDFIGACDPAQLRNNEGWRTSDSEWDAIYQLFASQEKRGHSKRKHELRTLIDDILEKLGTGVPWQKFQFHAGTWSNACKLYGECRKDGRWSEIQSILNRSRTQTF